MKNILRDDIGDGGQKSPDDVVLRFLKDAERPLGEFLQREVGIANKGLVEWIDALNLAQGKEPSLAGVAIG